MERCQIRPKESTKSKMENSRENVAEFIQLKIDQSLLRSKELKLNVRSGITQVGDNNKILISGEEMMKYPKVITTATRLPSRGNKKLFLLFTKIPKLPVRVGRRLSRKGFPDENDHEFIVSVFKSSVPGFMEKSDIDFYSDNKKKGKKYAITPIVNLCDQMEGAEANYQVKQIKSASDGQAVFIFRFHNRQSKLLVKFRLEVLPAHGSSKSKREIVDEISIEVDTVNGTNGKTRPVTSHSKRDNQCDIIEHYSASGSDVCETEPEIVKAVLFLNIGGPSSSEKSDKLKTRSFQIMKELHNPRDNGRWVEFERTANRLAGKFPDGDSQIAIQLEQSVAACYRDDLERSAAIIQQILHNLEYSSSIVNTNILAGRAYCYLSGVYRRQKQLGAAQYCVDLAQQCLCDTDSNLDKSFLAYEQGSIDLELTANESNLSPHQTHRTKQYLERCIDFCIRLEQQDDTLYVKKHHFAFIKVAMLLLDCRSTAGRQRTITADSIREAKAGLDTLEEKYWNDISQGERIQYYFGRADQFYRAKSYTRALGFAETALEMAVNLNFNTEIGPARARLHAIKAKLPDMPKINDTCTLSDLKLGSSTSESFITSPAEQD